MASMDTQLNIASLVEMGFDRDLVVEAFKATKNQGIAEAIEWLGQHPAKSPSEPRASTSQQQPMQTDWSESTGEQAASLKCDDCGKLLKGELEAQAHAAKTQHANFSESTEKIKPLTAEEKAKQLQRLHEKRLEIKQKKEAQEKEKVRNQEINRRRTGKEVTQMKEEMALREMQKIAEDRRKEKMEEKRLRQKLKEEIAKDRAAIKAKNSNASTNATRDPPTKQADPTTTGGVVKKDYDTSRVQFRLTDGSTMTSSFKADDTLRVVSDYVIANRTDAAGVFSLSTTFPRKVFQDGDMSKTLKELKLVPSTVLVVGKI